MEQIGKYRIVEALLWPDHKGNQDLVKTVALLWECPWCGHEREELKPGHRVLHIEDDGTENAVECEVAYTVCPKCKKHWTVEQLRDEVKANGLNPHLTSRHPKRIRLKDRNKKGVQAFVDGINYGSSGLWFMFEQGHLRYYKSKGGESWSGVGQTSYYPTKYILNSFEKVDGEGYTLETEINVYEFGREWRKGIQYLETLLYHCLAKRGERYKQQNRDAQRAKLRLEEILAEREEAKAEAKRKKAAAKVTGITSVTQLFGKGEDLTHLVYIRRGEKELNAITRTYAQRPSRVEFFKRLAQVANSRGMKCTRIEHTKLSTKTHFERK